MAANNKVIYGNDTIMDISDSTTSANNLLNGAIGYSGTGDRVVGSLIPATPDDLDKAELSIWNLVRAPYTSEGGQLSTGITATINSDGSVTFNGTSSGDTIFWFKGDGDPIYLPKRTSDYLFKCCPDGGSMNTYYANVLVYSGGSFVPIATNTNHQGIHVSTRNGDREVYVNAVIKDGTTVSDLTFNAPSILPIVPADGHVILNDSEAGLQQRRNLKFKGVYTKDTNSVDDITEVDIVRTMTKAQIEALTGESAKGFLIASDEEGDLPFTTDLVEYRNGKSATEALDNGFSNIAPVENGNTASQAYSQGSHFVWKGIRVVATSAIASGATLILYPTGSYNCKVDSIDNAIGNFITELAVNESIGVANNTSIIVAYGWSGLAAKGIVPLPSRYNLNSNYTYQMEIRNSTCNGMKIQNSPSFIDIVSKISKIDFYPNTNQAIFTFSTAPFGTTDGVVIIQGDFKITRKA